MYRSPAGDEYFIVDSHLHWWDGSPENCKNKYGSGFISCFYDYHSGLSPAEYVWPKEKYEKYSEETMMQDVFVDGYVDIGIFQPTYLTDFYVDGFNTTARDAILKDKYPDRFILNSSWDPRDGERGPLAGLALAIVLGSEAGGLKGRQAASFTTRCSRRSSSRPPRCPWQTGRARQSVTSPAGYAARFGLSRESNPSRARRNSSGSIARIR